MPFQDVIVHRGHRRLVGLLARSVYRDALPPSLIFSGPAGAGKRLTAIAIAQALNCLAPVIVEHAESGGQGPPDKAAGGQGPPDKTAGGQGPPDKTIDSCGRCAACLRIARGVHPDVLIVEPGENGSIKIDQVRDIVDRAGYRPFEGRRRVVIIDEADTMVAAAQNALLKTLEEPPSASVFILVTTRPDMLLATVQSRCPRLRFPGVGPDAIDGDAREAAQRVLAQAAASDEPGVRIEAAKDLLTSTGAGGASDRGQLTSHLRAMASLLRDVELLSTRADVRGLANPDVQPELDRLTKAYQGERGLRAFTAVDRALVALDRNAGVKIVADWLVLNL
jgi:DNA polymerase-3 subunit delta'